MKKTIKILLIILLSLIIFKPTYAVENNTINNTVTNTSNEVITEDGYNRNNKMTVEITGVEAGKKCENKEVSVDVNIKNANYITAGTIQIKYDSRLQYVDIENKNEEYTIQSVNNTNESIIVIAFSSNEGKTGDFKICSLKFKLPEKIEEEYYNISLENETNIITTSKIGNSYELISAVIHCENESNINRLEIVILIVVGIIIIGMLVIIIKKFKRQKNNKRK